MNSFGKEYSRLMWDRIFQADGMTLQGSEVKACLLFSRCKKELSRANEKLLKILYGGSWEECLYCMQLT